MSDLGFPQGTVIPQNGGMVQMGSDSMLTVSIFKKPVHNVARSRAEGRPIFDAIDYISIRQPGERDCVERPVQEQDKFRFARQWADYSNNRQPAPDGTPLALLFVEEVNITPMLNGMGFHTVEQLANATDTAIQNVGLGGREWVNRAKKFLEASTDHRAFHRMEQQLADLKSQNDVKSQQIEALVKQVDRLMAERHGQTGFPNARPAAHGSVFEQQYQHQPVQQAQANDYPMNYGQNASNLMRPAPATPEFEPVSFSTEPVKRRGRPAGSKNKPKDA